MGGIERKPESLSNVQTIWEGEKKVKDIHKEINYLIEKNTFEMGKIYTRIKVMEYCLEKMKEQKEISPLELVVFLYKV